MNANVAGTIDRCYRLMEVIFHQLPDAATFIISNNSALTDFTPSTLNEVIEDNPKLATLNFASFSTLPQLGSYTITVSNTALTGNYVEATLLVTTTAARVERIR